MHQKLFNVSINYHYLARTPLRMENHQPNSEAVQHPFCFVHLCSTSLCTQGTQSCPTSASSCSRPKLTKKNVIPSGIPSYSIQYCSGVSAQDHTLCFDYTQKGIRLVLAADSVCSCSVPSSNTYRRASKDNQTVIWIHTIWCAVGNGFMDLEFRWSLSF